MFQLHEPMQENGKPSKSSHQGNLGLAIKTVLDLLECSWTILLFFKSFVEMIHFFQIHPKYKLLFFKSVIVSNKAGVFSAKLHSLVTAFQWGCNI